MALTAKDISSLRDQLGKELPDSLELANWKKIRPSFIKHTKTKPALLTLKTSLEEYIKAEGLTENLKEVNSAVEASGDLIDKLEAVIESCKNSKLTQKKTTEAVEKMYSDAKELNSQLKADKKLIDDFEDEIKDLIFNETLNDKFLRKIFANFLESEYSGENIKFYSAVEDFNGDANLFVEIYEMYIPQGSKLEVNISAPQKLALKEIYDSWNKQEGKITSKDFDEAKGEIKRLMEKDSFPRFKKYFRKEITEKK